MTVITTPTPITLDRADGRRDRRGRPRRRNGGLGAIAATGAGLAMLAVVATSGSAKAESDGCRYSGPPQWLSTVAPPDEATTVAPHDEITTGRTTRPTWGESAAAGEPGSPVVPDARCF
jgi:hypothetical protein